MPERSTEGMIFYLLKSKSRRDGRWAIQAENTRLVPAHLSGLAETKLSPSGEENEDVLYYEYCIVSKGFK